MKSYLFRVELEKDDELDVWSAVIPALPGCAVDEESPEAALEAIQEMARMYVEVLLEDGSPIPLDTVESGTEGVAVAVVA